VLDSGERGSARPTGQSAQGPAEHLAPRLAWNQPHPVPLNVAVNGGAAPARGTLGPLERIGFFRTPLHLSDSAGERLPERHPVRVAGGTRVGQKLRLSHALEKPCRDPVRDGASHPQPQAHHVTQQQCFRALTLAWFQPSRSRPVGVALNCQSGRPSPALPSPRWEFGMMDLSCATRFGRNMMGTDGCVQAAGRYHVPG
jgi:hypothetical protein